MKIYFHYLSDPRTRFFFHEEPHFDAEDRAAIEQCDIERGKHLEEYSLECEGLAANVEAVNGLPANIRERFEAILPARLISKIRGVQVNQIYVNDDVGDSSSGGAYQIPQARVRQDFKSDKNLSEEEARMLEYSPLAFRMPPILGASPLYVLTELYPDLILFK